MPSSNFRVYAYVQWDDDFPDVALVSAHDTSEDAYNNIDVQKQCYSDEGIKFFALPSGIEVETNCKYLDLIERMSK